MKKSLSIYSLAAFLVEIIGLMFKSLLWPGASQILILGTLLIIIALILLACHFSKNTDAPKLAVWFGALALVVLAIAAMFKFLHWPGGSMLMIISGCLCLIEFIILLIYIIKK